MKETTDIQRYSPDASFDVIEKNISNAQPYISLSLPAKKKKNGAGAFAKTLEDFSEIKYSLCTYYQYLSSVLEIRLKLLHSTLNDTIAILPCNNNPYVLESMEKSISPKQSTETIPKYPVKHLFI